jgi:hypothetical protein
MAKQKKVKNGSSKAAWIVLLIVGIVVALATLLYSCSVIFLFGPGVVSQAGYFSIYSLIIESVKFFAVGVAVIVLSIYGLRNRYIDMKKAYLVAIILAVLSLVLDLIFDYWSYLSIIKLNILVDLVFIVIFSYLWRKK